MGAYSTGRCGFGAIHLGELDCRARWLLHKSSLNSFPGSHPCRSRDYWRDCRFESGKQASCCPGNFAFTGDSPSYRRNEIDFHEVGASRAKPYSASHACSHGPMGRLYPFDVKQTAEDRPRVRTPDGFVLRRAGGYPSSSFGAVSGDQGLVL